MLQYTGPAIDDEIFFGQLLDYTVPELVNIQKKALCGDYINCRKLFAEFFRKELKPEKFFKSIFKDGRVEMTDELYDKAEKACRHYMVSCGTPYDFGKENRVDWFFNPTYNKYKEWTWQLSRHDELLTLARAYRATCDEKYAAACAELIDSWLKQAVSPEEPCVGYDTLCWRTIECGIRQGLRWPEIIHSFYKSPEFTDDLIVDWCKSVWEHGNRLRKDHCTGNWLIMEMDGLLHIGILYPFFKESAEWYSYALNKLIEELKIQVYPDGFQYELSTNYQDVVIGNYVAAVSILKAYDKKVPEEIISAVREMLMLNIKLMRPDRRLPDINDGTTESVKNIVGRYMRPLREYFNDDLVFQWLLSDGDSGCEPEECSLVLPYSGIAVLRTGWNIDDTWMLFDGGPFGRGHQHEDKLNLLMFADGKYILAEGNNYAYDTSEMRRYVLSSRAHNTVMADGKEQNRRKNYSWTDNEIGQLSDILANLSEYADAVRSVYREGYGEDAVTDVTHERSVYLLKRIEGCRPFAVVIDRLYAADGEHFYDVLWHIDSPDISISGMDIKAGTLNIFTAETPMETAGLTVARGQQHPCWQGWLCDAARQKEFRPVYTAQYKLHGRNMRWATVLYPNGGEECPICSIDASTDIESTVLILNTKDGGAIKIDEKDLWN